MKTEPRIICLKSLKMWNQKDFEQKTRAMRDFKDEFFIKA